MKKRKDGRYVLPMTIQGKRIYFYGKTQNEAKNKAAEYQLSLQQPYSSDMLLRDWIESWLNIIATKVTEATLDSYTTVIRLHILPLWGDIPLNAISHIDVRQKLIQKQEAGLSDRSVNYIRTIFSSIMKQAVTDELIQANPILKISKFKGNPKKEKVIITAQQFHALLAVITRNDQLKRMLSVAIRTGLRREELLGLTWSDIDYTHATLSVHQTVLRIKNEIVIVNATKTKTSVRTIQLPQSLLAVFKEQRRDILNRKLTNSRYVDHNLVFCTRNGGPINPVNLTHSVSKYKKLANLPEGFSYYSLRHTHATMLIEEGVSIKALQERMGHKNFATTAGYLHVTPQTAKDCADKIEKALSI